MEALKKILGTFCVSALLVSASNASWLSNFIEKGLGASITSENAGYYKSQASGFVTGGGARIRWASPSSIRPFSVQAPKFNVGCNGIDFTFGSFSYLNFDQLVQKLKKMSSAAPAFAFQIALSTLCKDCQAILGELEGIANAINNMNFDTCNMMMDMAKNVGSALNDQIFDGKANSWNTNLKEYAADTRKSMQKWTNDINSGFKGLFATESPSNIKESQGSVIKDVMEKMQENSSLSHTYLATLGKENYEDLARALFGDLYVYKIDDQVIAHTIEPSLEPAEFMKVFWEGKDEPNKISYKIYDMQCNINGCSPAIPKLFTEDNVTSIKSSIIQNIETIVENIQKDKPTQADIVFINETPLAIADILNLVSTNKIQFDDNIKDYISLKLFDSFMTDFIIEVNKGISDFLNANGVKYNNNIIQPALSKFSQQRYQFAELMHKELMKTGDKIKQLNAAIDITQRDVQKAFQTNPMLAIKKEK